MKKIQLTSLLILVACPVSLFATAAMDRKIEAAARSSYTYHTVLDDRIQVAAQDGVVTLTGTALDKDDKALAADTVENLPGVTRVKNEIVVDSTYPVHSDAWIALKIRSSLLVKSNVSASNTKVTVKDGAVILTGTADSQAQKDLTGLYAKEIDHVKSVQNDLVIQGEPAAPLTLGEKIDDASITSQVKFALLSHRSTSALKTKVTTHDGAIVITGQASSEAEMDLVTQLARAIRGVSSVDNRMTVKG